MSTVMILIKLMMTMITKMMMKKMMREIALAIVCAFSCCVTKDLSATVVATWSQNTCKSYSSRSEHQMWLADV